MQILPLMHIIFVHHQILCHNKYYGKYTVNKTTYYTQSYTKEEHVEFSKKILVHKNKFLIVN